MLPPLEREPSSYSALCQLVHMVSEIGPVTSHSVSLSPWWKLVITPPDAHSGVLVASTGRTGQMGASEERVHAVLGGRTKLLDREENTDQLHTWPL